MRTFLISCIFSLASLVVSAQNGFDKSKLEFGGSIGMTFGDYTSINISPQVGYKLTNWLSTGLGVAYLYNDYNDYHTNYAGATLYGRIRPIKNIVLQIQPEFYRTWGNLFDSQFVPCVLVGAGVILPIGNNGGVSMTLSYDLVQDKYSPYNDELIYSVGYVIGF